MANKKTQKVPVDKKCFLEVIKKRGSSIRKLGAEEAYREIQRTEKTIRRCLDAGEMPPDLLESIARYLKVHPDLLSGKYKAKADNMKDTFLKYLYLQSLNPDKYPYLLKEMEDIDYVRHFEDILTMNKISMEQFKTLDPFDRYFFRKKIVLAVLEVIAEYFTVNSLGEDLSEQLDYCRTMLDDFDPDSLFAHLEGLGLADEDLVIEDYGEPTTIDMKYAEYTEE